ncbi:MAG TPA: hypothetical protein VFC38_04200 [Stellaceae bacterium]|nr:hypothetical protein [Stellaceae bacterium]
MSNLKNLLGTGALAAVLAAGVMAATTTVASADVACNSYGECWQTTTRYTTYPPALGVQFYGDDWAVTHRTDTHYQWRDSQKDDHGYYDHGDWHPFGN